MVEKALEYAKALGVTEFNASGCWLNNWKKRYNLSISISFEYFYKVFATYFLFQQSLTSKAVAFLLITKINFFASYYNFAFYTSICSKEIKYHLPLLPRGKCPTMKLFFFTQTAYLSTALSGTIAVFNSSFINDFHRSLYA